MASHVVFHQDFPVRLSGLVRKFKSVSPMGVLPCKGLDFDRVLRGYADETTDQYENKRVIFHSEKGFGWMIDEFLKVKRMIKIRFPGCVCRPGGSAIFGAPDGPSEGLVFRVKRIKTASIHMSKKYTFK
jgi:hypothetical protein